MKRVTDPKQKKLKLSSLLESSSSQDKVSLANRQISIINEVPERYRSIKVMYLSQNFISDISHISQFPLLKVLSLSYNEITSFKSMVGLESLLHLQILNLVGNPVCRNILYNCYVLGSCSRTLEKLDNVEIVESELGNQRERRLLISNKFQQLYNNYTQIMRLYSSLGSEHERKSPQVVWQFLYNDCFEIYNQSKEKCGDKQLVFLDAMKDLEIRQLEKIQELFRSVKQNQEELFEGCEEEEEEEEEYSRWLESQRMGLEKVLALYDMRIKRGMDTIRMVSEEIKARPSNANSTIQKSRLSSITSVAQRYREEQRQSVEYTLASTIIRKKREQRLIKKKYIQIWKDRYTTLQISKQTQYLYTKLNEFQEKESKYLQKIELLEELVEINKEKRKSLSNFQSRQSDRVENKENTPARANSSRIVRQRSVMKLSEDKFKSLVKRKLGERSS